jgi:hypothetical protein
MWQQLIKNMIAILSRPKRIRGTYSLDKKNSFFLLTAQQEGIKPGDSIELHSGEIFLVVNVYYYSDPADMFISEVISKNG